MINVNLLVLIPLFTGILSMIIGYALSKKPSKEINGIRGYRTPNSKRNQQTWDFAQIYSAKESVKLGLILALCSLIGLFYNPDEITAMVIGVGLMLLSLIVLFIRVELAIKNKFPKG